MSNATRLAAFLLKLGHDADLESLREEILILFPGITRDEWMEGFAIHDERVLSLEAAFDVTKSFDTSAQMANLGWNKGAST